MSKQRQSLKGSKGPDIISFNTSKKILNNNGNQYTDEEIYKIREYLYQLVEIQCRHFEQWRQEQNRQSVNSVSEKTDPA